MPKKLVTPNLIVMQRATDRREKGKNSKSQKKHFSNCLLCIRMGWKLRGESTKWGGVRAETERSEEI